MRALPWIALLTALALGCAPRPTAPGGEGAPEVASPESQSPESGESAVESAPGFRATPSLDGLPAGRALAGVMDDTPFVARSVLVECDPLGRLRKLRISDKPLERDDALSVEGSEFVLELPEDIDAGLRFAKSLDAPAPEGARLSYCRRQPDGTPMVVRPAWSCALAIDSGRARAYDVRGEFVQIAGRFSGRIALSCESVEEGKTFRSWIAGEFGDAPARYWGPPTPPRGGEEGSE